MCLRLDTLCVNRIPGEASSLAVALLLCSRSFVSIKELVFFCAAEYGLALKRRMNFNVCSLTRLVDLFDNFFMHLILVFQTISIC